MGTQTQIYVAIPWYGPLSLYTKLGEPSIACMDYYFKRYNLWMTFMALRFSWPWLLVFVYNSPKICTCYPKGWTLHTTCELMWVLEEVLFWGINVNCIHKGEVLLCFSLYILEGYQNFESKVDVQRGGQGLEKIKIDNRCLSFIQFMFSSIATLW
jgi:hypothetical protein